MITSDDFHKLTYRKPYLKDEKPKMENIAGIDSEAYTTGEPFMFCTGFGDVIIPENLISFLIDRYSRYNFMVFNLKYDSGALLYHIPKVQLYELWRFGETSFSVDTKSRGRVLLEVSYIPHKLLRFKYGKEKIWFWDIAQFYKMSLDRAAHIYLNKRKIDIRTKNFTSRYVKRFWNSIAKYCIQDARLTHLLGEYFVDKLDEFGITVSTIYSCASISFKYFCEHSKVCTSWRFWKNDRKLLKMAVDAYEGGKFEVTARGHFEGYEYDLTSAYPFEISNLIDIEKCRIHYSKQYVPEAVYGFIQCEIDNTEGYHLPCGIMVNGVRVYPRGRYFLTITKQEYEYLIELGAEVDIHDAVWLTVKRKNRPYRKVIDTLFDLKQQYKGKDKMLYNTTKIIMNSFYGKTCQCTPDIKTGTIRLGAGFNPVHASVITANTRIKVARIQNQLKNRCLAVHTDSVMTLNPLPGDMISDGLGEFEYVTKGEGILIACGMYQLGTANAFKGFRAKNKMTWTDILTKWKNRKSIPYRDVHVESWVEAQAKNHSHESINFFDKSVKKIDLNCDTKRNWSDKWKARDFLTRFEYSEPKMHLETEPPKSWKNF